MAADFRAWLDHGPAEVRLDLDTLKPCGAARKIQPSRYVPFSSAPDVTLQEFEFLSPALSNPIVRRALPPECRKGRFLMVTPSHAPAEAVTVHLPATGDHWYWMRLGIAVTLAQKHRIGSVILEGPWYGRRTPPGQIGAKLRAARELLLLGATTVEESRAIIYWLRNNEGHAKLGLTGFSQGGLHSAMTACLLPFSVACVCSLAPHSAVPVFTPPGEMAHNVDWESLAKSLPCGTQSSRKAVDRLRDLFSVGLLSVDASGDDTSLSTDIQIENTVGDGRYGLSATAGKRRRRHSTLRAGGSIRPSGGYWLWEEAWPDMKSEKMTAGHVTGFLGVTQARVPEALVQAFSRLKTGQQHDSAGLGRSVTM